MNDLFNKLIADDRYDSDMWRVTRIPVSSVKILPSLKRFSGNFSGKKKCLLTLGVMEGSMEFEVSELRFENSIVGCFRNEMEHT